MTELDIKKLLVEYILNTYEEPVLSIEYSFQFGERRADVALLAGSDLIAFEIKTAQDSTNRLSYQINSYKSLFDYCYVVCEPDNIKKVRNSIPASVGLMSVADGNIITTRKSKKFKKLDKKIVSDTLSIRKLASLVGKKNSKQELCTEAAKRYSLDKLRKSSRIEFKQRFETPSRLLRQEVGKVITVDDIHTVTIVGPASLQKTTTSEST